MSSGGNNYQSERWRTLPESSIVSPEQDRTMKIILPICILLLLASGADEKQEALDKIQGYMFKYPFDIVLDDIRVEKAVK